MSMIRQYGQVQRNPAYLLDFTVLIVPPLSMDQQYCKVDNIEVGERGAKACGEGPGKSHQEITAATLICVRIR
jgi:hypothetical protein